MILVSIQEIKESINSDLDKGLIRFRTALNIVLNSNIDIHLTRPDLFRILNLLTWCDRYSISLEEILKVLLPIWRKRFQTTSKALGVRLSVLSGPKSKDIIKQYIKKTYPNKEHIQLKKQLDCGLLLTSVNLLDSLDPMEYIKRYKYNIIALRKEDRKRSKTMQRRKWRSNPFI